MRFLTLACPFLFAIVLGAQTRPEACCTGLERSSTGGASIAVNPVVEVSGTIGETLIAVRQGIPYVDVKEGNRTTRLFLGAMHFLIAHDFNPKTGQHVSAKGYKTADGVVGIEATLPSERKTVKLRDERGWPLWRGGPGRLAWLP